MKGGSEFALDAAFYVLGEIQGLTQSHSQNLNPFRSTLHEPSGAEKMLSIAWI